MREQLRKAREEQSGFTLIELLIVIVILGVLAAVVVFSVQGISDRGKASACAADKKTVEVAGEAYYAKNGSYAADMPALVSAGFLHDPSTKVTYALVGTPVTGFTVTTSTAAGVCS
jgi:general secretion pathway protein G